MKVVFFMWSIVLVIFACSLGDAMAINRSPLASMATVAFGATFWIMSRRLGGMANASS